MNERDLRARFDQTDRAFNGGKGYSEENNEKSLLAWGESYLLMAYADMYQATGEIDYLRRLADHFARILKNRDDVRGIADAYAKKPLAGWGSGAYSDGKWHAWIVHTGMITLGAAEMVRLARRERRLRREFGATIETFQSRLEECVRDTEPYWREGPGPGEGAYFGAHLNAVLPTNQQNALGGVCLELAGATGNRDHRERAAKLARWFKNRLRRPTPTCYEWAYWPREKEDGPGSEDISHASLNIDFAVRCERERVVFDRRDLERFARAWHEKVKKPDGTWAGHVGGEGDGKQYLPFAAGAWLCLVPRLSREDGRELYEELSRACTLGDSLGTTGMLAIARLLRARKALGIEP